MTNIEILEKEIKITKKEDIIRGSKNYFKCKVIFDEFWNDFEKTIVFKSVFKNTPFMVYVSEMESEVNIPLEVLTESGTFKIGAFGIKNDITLPTLWSEELKVLPGSDTSGEIPQPDETIYEQILKNLGQKQDTLISGENIKTINGQNILGAGDIEVNGGSAIDLSNYYTKEETDNIISEQIGNALGDIETLLGGI